MQISARIEQLRTPGYRRSALIRRAAAGILVVAAAAQDRLDAVGFFQILRIWNLQINDDFTVL